MSEFKTGDIVRILFDYDTPNEKVYKGTILQNVTVKMVRVIFDDGDIKFNSPKRLKFLVEECQKYEKSKLPIFLKPRTFKCCPFCGATNINQDDWAEIEKKEFKISGLCVKCQRDFFK